jgi:hypothetical protein
VEHPQKRRWVKAVEPSNRNNRYMLKSEKQVKETKNEKHPYQKPELKKHGKLKSTATQTSVYTYTYIT